MHCRRCSMPTWRARRAADCCCASRISTPRAAGRNTRRRSMKIWRGSDLHWESPVRRQSEHWDDYRAALAQLEAMGLIYPSFESRAEIARLVADREAQGPWPRDPDGAPLYPGDAKNMTRWLNESGASKPASPTRCGSTCSAAMLRAGTLNWIETGAGPGGADRYGCGRSRSLGRRDSGAQGDPDQLSPCGRCRRRRARRDRRGARTRPVSRNRGPPLAPGAARSAARRATIITGLFSMQTATSCRNRRNLPACASFARAA